ncbi:ATP-binding protein [Myroides sp. M-43]|uniref:sensor histidine kinase n=1 Tax=Myroides oncorhynchi TaxID=2893756 RepID=UPI001E60DA4C|nr:ATP-binding protein [Myroides oncorhynchi]MCC9044228.1 ATP-binding protein [Myroides oncorhynchi]
MKRLRQINFLLVTIALVFVNCTRSHIDSRTDYDQLYAVWHDDAYKDSVAQVLKPAVENALNLKNSFDNRVVIDTILSQLRWTQDSESFLKLSSKAIDYADKKSDLYMLAKTYNHLGVYYSDLGILDSTFYYYLKTGNIYRQLGDSLKIAETEFYQARVLYEKGLHMESEVKIAESLGILYKFPKSPVSFEANLMMGLCLSARKDDDGAKKYLLKALNLMKEDLNKNKVLDQDRLIPAILMVYINLFDIAYYSDDYQKAKEYVAEGSKYLTKDTPPLLIMVLKSNLAMCNLSTELKLGKLKNSLPYLDDMFPVYYEAIKVNNLMAANYQAITLVDTYIKVKDTLNALKWAEKSYKISKDRGIKVDQQVAIRFMLEHKNYENSDRVKEILALNQDIEETDYFTRNRFARIAYETDKIEVENTELKSIITIIMVTGLSIILGLLLIVFTYRLRNKNRQIKLIKHQQEANESIYELILEKSNIATEVKNNVRNKIAKDLHDGVVNGIFTIRFNLQQLNSDNETLKNTLISELQHLEKGTRDISHSLIDNELFKETKFLSLVEDLVSLQKNKWNTKFLLDYQGQLNLEDLSAIDKVNTYFIIREAIHNVNKYSKASLCTVSFVGGINGIIIKIKDNGIGFDVEAKSGGMGLQNMNERALSLHSEIVIFSEKAVGTEVYFKVMLQEVC